MNFKEIETTFMTIKKELDSLGLNTDNLFKKGGFFSPTKLFFYPISLNRRADNFFTISEVDKRVVCTFNTEYNDPYEHHQKPVSVDCFLDALTDDAASLVSELPEFSSAVSLLQSKLSLSHSRQEQGYTEYLTL
jgi:hypothetical protein